MSKSLSKRDNQEFEIFRLIKKIKYENDETSYDTICEYMKPYIDMLCKKFIIAGLGNDDIAQECLFALRYKAIDDFNPDRGRFKTFAVLCIKRHLFSIIKGNNQHKKKALNVSLSIDESHNKDGVDLMLRNLITSDDINIDEKIQEKENEDIRQGKLEEKLSDFERDVFIFYKQRYRYDEIAEMLQEKRPTICTKAIDNAVQRIKAKAKKIAKSKNFW